MRFSGCGVGHAGAVDGVYTRSSVQQLLDIAPSSQTSETLEANFASPRGKTAGGRRRRC